MYDWTIFWTAFIVYAAISLAMGLLLTYAQTFTFWSQPGLPRRLRERPWTILWCLFLTLWFAVIWPYCFYADWRDDRRERKQPD